MKYTKEQFIKAAELVGKFNIDLKPFSEYGEWNKMHAKKCALIAVNEIIESIPIPVIKTFDGLNFVEYEDTINYWEGVKQEIEKL